MCLYVEYSGATCCWVVGNIFYVTFLIIILYVVSQCERCMVAECSLNTVTSSIQVELSLLKSHDLLNEQFN